MLNMTSNKFSHVVRRPTKGWQSLNLRELWRYRFMISLLVKRTILVQYKQSVLGIGWMFIRPIATVLVFTVFYGQLLAVPSEGESYTMFNYVAVVPWTLFTTVVGNAANSLTGNANLITKVYIPRLAFPIVGTFISLFNTLIPFVLMLILLVFTGEGFTVEFFVAPFWLLLAIITALGIGLWMASLNVIFRDVGFIVSYLTQALFYATPVVYSAEIIPETWRKLLYINPMATVVTGFRWSFLNTEPVNAIQLLLSCLVAGALFLSGLYFFQRTQKILADVV